MYLNISAKCVLLVTLVTLLSASVFGGKGKEIHVNVDEYHTCIPLAFRPAHTTVVPGQRIQIYGETLTATRHHIIPFHTLSTFINMVLRENPFESGLGAYLAINVREIYRYFEENAAAGAFPSLSGPQRPNPTVLFLHGSIPISFGGRSATFDVDHRMLAAFTWTPGNLFYGPPPNRRAHDPGDNLEVDAERIVGSEAFAVLRRIYNNMQNFINNPSQRTATNYDAIIADLTAVSSARSRPYAFNEDDWVVAGVSGAGKLYDIKKHGVVIEEVTTQNPHDELKKRSVGGSITDDEYLQATEIVCEEYLKHIKPKFNTKFTQIDIEHDVVPLFVYSVDNNHFVYGQNEKTLRWFIKRVDDNGKVGAVTDQGTWTNYYAVQVHYEIDGKHYFYGHNLNSRYWFIQQLTADGKMGRETNNGFFGYNYKTVFYIGIKGKHYLYGQNEEGKNWFLQILHSDGTLGEEVAHGRWDHFYDLQFPIKIGDKQYFAGHNSNTKQHFIRDINAGNLDTMGKPNVWTDLDRSYSVFFPFTFAAKTYFFGHDPNSKHFFVREVFGNVVEQENIDIAFTDARPFNINGYQYFYAKLKGSSQWNLFHFDFNYFDK